MRYLVWTVVLVAVVAVAAVLYLDRRAEADQGDFYQHAVLDRFDNAYWLQGEAEVNLYRASLVKYGKPRATDDVVHILVTEKHDPALLVKADDWRRSGLLDVLKFNVLVQVQTGVYPYRQMATAFFDRSRGRLAKLTFTSQEWCGTSFKELVNFRGRSSFTYNTYWDGEGSGSYEVDFPSDAVAYDTLPVQLRLLEFQPGLKTSLPLVGSQFSSRAERPRFEMARIEVGSAESVSVPLGEFEGVPVRVETGVGSDLLWFEAGFPHRMLRWETRDGNLFELKQSRKNAYWTLNRPSDQPYFEW